MADPAKINGILDAGAEKARVHSGRLMAKLRKATGIAP